MAYSRTMLGKPHPCFDFGEEDVPWEAGRHLYRLWLSKKSNGMLPARKDFSPLEFKAHLTNTLMVDVIQEPVDFRIRLVGNDFRDVFGEDTAGRLVSELGGGMSIHARWSMLLEMRKPYILLDIPLEWPGKEHKHYNALMLPLASDGITIDMLLSSIDFLPFKI